MNNRFIHLRVHSAYSLSEGAVHIKKLPDLCQQFDMPAVAITDTNNMFGALEASATLSSAGIQPIIGCALAITHEQKEAGPGQGKVLPPGWIVLLAQNEQGYKNLMVLVSRAHLETDSGLTPQVSLENLEGDTEGLICLTGGPGGPVGRLLLEGREKDARNVLRQLKLLFPGRLYVEILRHEMEDEEVTEEDFITLAYEMDLPLVATNEVFFPTREMYDAHDALLCIADGTYVEQEERRHLTPDHYFKSAEEMQELFSDLPEAIENTVVIAQRCAYKVPFVDPILPKFTIGEGMSEADSLRQVAMEGLQERLEMHVYRADDDADTRADRAKSYLERLDYELDIIIRMDFPGYFLIVSDFIQWAKDHDIPVGPGRGSGAGSVVAWALKITDLDPLRFGLLFERFLNPERVSMPDFDVDFCQEKRDQVIRYVQEKYGVDQVAQIITFGKLQARAVVRDVGRVLQMPYGQVDRISKAIPSNPANPITLSEALETEERLRQERDSDPTTARLIELAMQLEGLNRHASTHAAGVVIGDRPLDQLVPLYRDPRSDMPVTQFNMKWVEQAGLVKFDFLGLKTLTVLDKACALIAERGIHIELDKVPFDDPATFELLGSGNTVGVFQLESTGMRSVLMGMKPDSLEDIIAIVALYRPGPMDNIPRYIACKHGTEKPDYLHPLLEEILTETYGVIIYQEQVMQIAQILADYSLGEADLLRRAMGKKIPAEMDKQRVRFMEGAENKGVDAKQAGNIFDLVAKFAGYGFNKSHAAAYAVVAYHTAYLKANYPVEFMAALMTLDITNTDKLNIFKQELNNLRIPILPPDINKSQVVFSVEVMPDAKESEEAEFSIDHDGVVRGVRYGLAAVKNVGSAAVARVVEEREKNGPYKDMADFSQRVDAQQMNRRLIENLAKAGGFDSLCPNRAQLFLGADNIIRQASAATAQRNSAQESLFAADENVQALELPAAKDWHLIERLKYEQEAIGFYLSAHPLDAYDLILQRARVSPSSEIERKARSGGTLKLAGTIQAARERKSQRGNAYAFVSLSDSAGAFEVTLFSETLLKARPFLTAGQSVVMNVEVQLHEDNIRLTAQSIETLDQVAARSATGLVIEIADIKVLEEVKALLEDAKGGRGNVTLKLTLDDGEYDVDVALPGKYSITPALSNAISLAEGVDDAREI
ncbi:MAG: DNA polymerase III subunit alpha [Kordiimonas sp.]|nr:DNA polymerase III subunit alpha [Kordiimonas sp.]